MGNFLGLFFANFSEPSLMTGFLALPVRLLSDFAVVDLFAAEREDVVMLITIGLNGCGGRPTVGILACFGSNDPGCSFY